MLQHCRGRRDARRSDDRVLPSNGLEFRRSVVMAQRISLAVFATTLGVAVMAGVGGGGCASIAIAEGDIGPHIVAASADTGTVRVHDHDDSVDLDVGGR